MDHHLMIFRNEATGECFIYNGEEVINVTVPANEREVIWPDNELQEVEKAYTSRKKVFVHDKTRHIVIDHVRYKTD